MPQDLYTLTALPGYDPVSFNEASAWCRDIEAADESLVTALIAAAVDQLESMSNRIFVQKSYTGYFPGVCFSPYESYQFVEIKRAPLVSISEIRIDGVALDSSYYELKQSDGYSRVWFTGELSMEPDSAYPIEIDFIAGYGKKISITSLTLDAGVVTAVAAGHGLLTNQLVPIAGAVETDYNGEHKVTVIDVDTFTFPLTATPASPATGTITAEHKIPDNIKTMIEQVVLFWYENRGDVSPDEKQQIPFTAKQILKTIRIVDIY